MRIEARYSPGFCADLLRWELYVSNHDAQLRADWFECQNPVNKRFKIRTESLARRLDGIFDLEESYDSGVDDMPTLTLAVEDAARLHRCRVIPGFELPGLLDGEPPEHSKFYAIWDILEGYVKLQLADLID